MSSPITDSVAAFARIYQHARSLIRGRTVLDVGSCFGFLPLLLAEQDQRLRVIGTDVVPAAAALASHISRAQGSRARFAAANLLALPADDGAVDTVLAVHVLEHLPAEESAVALEQMCRVARRRVVIAVPLETVPDPAFGHVQAFDLPGLARIGANPETPKNPESPGWSREVHAADGGWLVPDRAGGLPDRVGSRCPN